MAASGRFAPFATSFVPTVRSSYATTTSSSRLCRHCLRAYLPKRPAVTSLRIPQRRGFATEAAEYRPHSLDQHPPPRNTGIPESSIAGGQSNLSTRPSTKLDVAKAGISESEAQVAKPVPGKSEAVGSVAAPEPAPGKPQRKSKLRPRKAAMKLTPAAVEALKELLDQPEPKLIRVGVKNRGCSGLAYHLEYVDKPGSFDEAVDQDGVKVLVDSKALFSIIGSEMDWIEDKLSRRFVFKNPNITEQCGCGESFSIS